MYIHKVAGAATLAGTLFLLPAPGPDALGQEMHDDHRAATPPAEQTHAQEHAEPDEITMSAGHAHDAVTNGPGEASPPRTGTPSLTLPPGQRSLSDTTVYRCPMHPDVTDTQPGRCPVCGMDLVRDAAPSRPAGAAAPLVDGALVQRLGIRTDTAQFRAGRRWISAPGHTAYDETRLFHLHPRAPGWIEGLAVRAEGEAVTEGQSLAALYAPDILSAQVSFLIALRDASSDRQVTQARSLLRLLAVPEAMISAIEKDGSTRNAIPVLSPSDGVITRLEARDGMYVTPETAMFTIADLSTVWLLLSVRESESARVRVGQTVEVRFDALPGRRYTGRVDYLYPDIDAATRSRPLRVVLDNKEGLLQPGLWARGRVHIGDGEPVLAVPADAVLDDGTEQVVLLARDDGDFQPVRVSTGRRLDDWVEVLDGVEAGDRVVTGAQFLIDAESDLQAALRRMAPPMQDHDHGR